MFLIDTLQTEDIPAVHSAFDIVAKENLFYGVDTAMPIAQFTEWMGTNFQNQSPQFVALWRESIIGWSIISRHDEPCRQHSGTLFMGLLSPWRGMGVGTHLLSAALDEAWQNGLARVQLEVYADNTRAIQLYRKLGFVEEGKRNRAHFTNGRYRDMLDMALLAEHAEESREMLRKVMEAQPEDMSELPQPSSYSISPPPSPAKYCVSAPS